MRKNDQINHIRFVLEMDGLRSVIDSTLPYNHVKQMILDEVDQRFKGDIKEVGESRFVGGPNEWHLQGRYLNER